MSRTTGTSLNPTDFYPTPPWCYENLDIDWSIFLSAHEPCRGDGRIQLFLEEQGLATTYSEILEGLDFYDWTEGTDLIITNPPFALLTDFADHSIKYSETCIFLLRLNFLGSVKRHEWWKQNTPTAIHVLSKRPSFTGTGTDATDYCWVVWDKTDRTQRGVFFVAPPSKEQSFIAKQLAFTKEELSADSETYQNIILDKTLKT
tara:strand:- start:141 stop:749 length:609 start_codon:yes stop_codon:yes gene_type:complete